jgi:hypothetical protein
MVAVDAAEIVKVYCFFMKPYSRERQDLTWRERGLEEGDPGEENPDGRERPRDGPYSRESPYSRERQVL